LRECSGEASSRRMDLAQSTRFTDGIARAEALKPKGYCLMMGGEPEDFTRIEPILKTLAPPEGYLYLCRLDRATSSKWSITASNTVWLLELTALAPEQDPGLENLKPWVDDSCEGKWTIAESFATSVSALVIALSLMMIRLVS
jgi:6-phosphogluconate dehydrogenase